jgi:ribonucleoside-diphosphate reductase beta chain
MTQVEDIERRMRLDRDSDGQGYFEHAVYNHWDPYEDIPASKLDDDCEKLVADEDLTEDEFEGFMRTLALFGAGEEAVTEDLAPLSIALDDVDDQMFIASQLYEEAKHTQFFDRYWREVVLPVADEHGFEATYPTNQRFFNDDYVALFDKNEQAMERLLTDDTPENRAKAYCHYHLVVESVLAQTGYYGLQSTFSPSGDDDVPQRDLPHLEGLVEGITYIRSDEGRHVGFGMKKVQHLIAEEGVEPSVVQDTLQELMPHVANIVGEFTEVTDPVPLVNYSRDKLTRRIEIITDADAEVPAVDELVKVDAGSGERAAGDD